MQYDYYHYYYYVTWVTDDLILIHAIEAAHCRKIMSSWLIDHRVISSALEQPISRWDFMMLLKWILHYRDRDRDYDHDRDRDHFFGVCRSVWASAASLGAWNHYTTAHKKILNLGNRQVASHKLCDDWVTYEQTLPRARIPCVIQSCSGKKSENEKCKPPQRSRSRSQRRYLLFSIQIQTEKTRDREHFSLKLLLVPGNLLPRLSCWWTLWLQREQTILKTRFFKFCVGRTCAVKVSFSRDLGWIKAAQRSSSDFYRELKIHPRVGNFQDTTKHFPIHWASFFWETMSPQQNEQSVHDVINKIWTDISGCLPCKGKAQTPPLIMQRAPPAGVGIVFEILPDDVMRVHHVLPNSEAEEQGIKAGDILLEVDGVKVCMQNCDLNLENLVRSKKDDGINCLTIIMCQSSLAETSHYMHTCTVWLRNILTRRRQSSVCRLSGLIWIASGSRCGHVTHTAFTCNCRRCLYMHMILLFQ